MEGTKSYCISKTLVKQAYERVKANHGSYGVDKQSIADFEKNQLQISLEELSPRGSGIIAQQSEIFFIEALEQLQQSKANLKASQSAKKSRTGSKNYMR